MKELNIKNGDSLEIFSESTGEAWEKLSMVLLDSGKKVMVQNESVVEIRWLSIHVKKPLREPRMSDKFNDFCKRINLEEEWKPRAYFLQVTGKVKEGYWWNVYGKPIWEQMSKLEGILRQNPSYNKPSLVIRNSMKNLGARNTPCLVYLTFFIRNGKLELGAHLDTNAIEYIQGNMYGLSELQKMVAEKLNLEICAYHHYCDSLFVSEKHLHHLKETMRRVQP